MVLISFFRRAFVRAYHTPIVKPTEQPTKAIPKSLKKLVWDTYVGPMIGQTKCLCCNHQLIRQIEFHCGHVVAKSKGGAASVENLRPICAQCNLSMKSQDLNAFKTAFYS